MCCTAETWQSSYDKEALQQERDYPSDILEYWVNIDRNTWQTLIMYVENGFAGKLKLGQKHEGKFQSEKDQVCNSINPHLFTSDNVDVRCFQKFLVCKIHVTIK